MIKLIASDLDGTILTENNHICQNNLEAIHDIHKKNIPFVICSGKTYPIIKGLCSQFNASYGVFGNGNQIIDLKTGKEIYQNLLQLDDVKFCYSLAKKHHLHIHVYTNQEVITEELMYLDLRNYKLKESKFYDTDLSFSVVDNIITYIEKEQLPILKLVISSEKNLNQITSELNENNNLSVLKISKRGKHVDNIIQKEYEYLDITPTHVNKKNALEFLRDYLRLDNSEIMAIGDNLNDLEMVKSFGVGVAVANAYDEIKKVANYTTANSVENGGFAEAVYKFVAF